MASTPFVRILVGFVVANHVGVRRSTGFDVFLGGVAFDLPERLVARPPL